MPPGWKGIQARKSPKEYPYLLLHPEQGALPYLLLVAQFHSSKPPYVVSRSHPSCWNLLPIPVLARPHPPFRATSPSDFLIVHPTPPGLGVLRLPPLFLPPQPGLVARLPSAISRWPLLQLDPLGPSHTDGPFALLHRLLPFVMILSKCVRSPATGISCSLERWWQWRGLRRSLTITCTTARSGFGCFEGGRPSCFGISCYYT